MKPSPYLIEFHGGRFDGLCQPSDFALASTRLEMPGPDLAIPNGVAARRDIYILRRSTVAFIEQSPVVTYHVHHIGAKIAAPQPKLVPDWINSIRAVLQRFRLARDRIRKSPTPGLGRRPAGRAWFCTGRVEQRFPPPKDINLRLADHDGKPLAGGIRQIRFVRHASSTVPPCSKDFARHIISLLGVK